MGVLGGWGAANLLYSGIEVGSATGSNKYFHRMNLIWGGVNFTLGSIGFLFTKNKDGLDYSQSLKKQISIEKVYLFNAGLDVAYVAGGFYLKERANQNIAKYDQYRGYGKSIILQGAALFLFDGIMYLVHQNHGKNLFKIPANMQIGIRENGINCLVNFK